MDGIATGDSSYSGVQVIEQAPSDLFQGHPTIFLGDVKLVDVKNALYQKGINVCTLSIVCFFSLFSEVGSNARVLGMFEAELVKSEIAVPYQSSCEVCLSCQRCRDAAVIVDNLSMETSRVVRRKSSRLKFSTLRLVLWAGLLHFLLLSLYGKTSFFAFKKVSL